MSTFLVTSSALGAQVKSLLPHNPGRERSLKRRKRKRKKRKKRRRRRKRKRKKKKKKKKRKLVEANAKRC
ncbi:hypothetical protein CRUP_025320 [Coryphaenoides rupestris]|nr:hypothetical protein CRUP_025320 [Coryphaenoides rupestris]